MNKQKFMEELEVLLSTMHQVERDEALQYYTNYFEDAGEEKESEVLEELGTPAEVAKTIFNEIGQPNIIVEEVNVEQTEKIEQKGKAEQVQQETPSQNGTMSRSRKIGMIVTSPIWFPILLSIWIVLISLIFTMGIIAFVIAIVALVCVIVGIAAALEGIFHMFMLPAYGMCIIGSGFVSVAVAILLILLVILLVKIVIPGLSKLFFLSYTLPFKIKEGK